MQRKQKWWEILIWIETDKEKARKNQKEAEWHQGYIWDNLFSFLGSVFMAFTSNVCAYFATIGIAIVFLFRIKNQIV
jgi:hypothetical protein